jgi:hypothetical protein
MARGNKIGNKTSLTAKYTYGEQEEIHNRDKGAFQNRPTSFKQIGPEDHGGNLNVPSHSVRSGKFKFNPPVN